MPDPTVRLGPSALVATHDCTESLAMSDRILLLNFDRMGQQGTPEEVCNGTRTQYTAEFMGSSMLPGKVSPSTAAARCCK
jgi:ABC-type Fe3+/spermidine/putrescine transport system ATPase subunit